ncbi:McrB family protein [Chryseobacterium aureum]|uniref:McrB family protein n=1 Tax=Chryseobacterium aureum TaxID=2497456 RepID=UPI000F89B27F|nr:AAA family ATPase [Chryseobacterium aureum]
MTIQETYNHFINKSDVENWDWYNSLKRYSEILQEIKQEAKLNRYQSYSDLNHHFQVLANEKKEDFLDRYLFRKNNGLSEIPQQLITINRRNEILNEVNSSFSALNNILKEDNIKACLKLILEFIDQNKWSVANRFLRALFPKHFTSIDSYKHFELLKKKLKADFGIVINAKDVVEKNELALSLIQFEDIYKAQIFFWMLKGNQTPSLEDISKNTTNIMATNQTEEKFPINQILFGPPGTGKTYHTINKAVEIINSDFDSFQSRGEIKDEFRNLVEEGQIVFTTFHQSMSYEDFIEGIKPETVEDKDGNKNIIYEIKDGIFKLIADKAKDNWLSSQSTDATRLSFEEAFTKLKEDWEENNEIKFSLTKKGFEFTILGFTGKSIKFKKSSGTSNHTLSINTLRDFYYGKREPKKTGVGIYYPSILDKLLSYSSSETQKPELQNFVLIIDEINRGNVSQIFGELITLIEEDKRLGNDESLEITLPYSKEKFGVPPNLYIIGTMNTADRSVEALDTALRRRFSFEEMPPKPELLLSPSEMIEKLLWDYKDQPWEDKEYELKERELFDFLNAPEKLWNDRKKIWETMKLDKDNGNIKHGTYFTEYFTEVDFKNLLITINKRIEKLIDKDHAIGHAYFMGKNNETIVDSFYKNIIPLLQEYFFGDYGKIGLVLGKGFVKKKDSIRSVFAAFDYENDYSERESYEIIDYRKPNTISDNGMTFIEAVNLLMN